MTTRIAASLVAAIALIALNASSAQASSAVYGYECRGTRCVKVMLNDDNLVWAQSLPVCRMFCGDELGGVWPRPTGAISVQRRFVAVDVDVMKFKMPEVESRQLSIWDACKTRFTKMMAAKLPRRSRVLRDGALPLVVAVQVDINTLNQTPRLTLDTDESYTLKISQQRDGTVLAIVLAKTYFGSRHGLETLLQMIVYDDIRQQMVMIADAEIHDAPVYKWRGLLLDTSRHFHSLDAIKRTLDGMAMTKLNTFHWHMTDSQAFTFEVKSQPELSRYGTYSPDKVYTHEDVIEIVEYGRVRGIRVMPEYDAPAHVGEGFHQQNLTACFNAQPWANYCAGPPCGHLDPTNGRVYNVLEDIYREMLELFHTDVFHMGGDEVAINCWNSSAIIRDWMTEQGWDIRLESSFMRLWGYFQTKALERVDKVAGENKPLVTLWTSRLTDVPYIDDYLDKDRYIIQIWTKSDDPVIQDILSRGFRVVVSNYDALYFDCGGPGWVAAGNNWCSPYIGWQIVYDNDLSKMAGNYSEQVLGSEANVWSTQIDEHTLDARFWPRASALAERLWSNPSTKWQKAESRMLMHRERLVAHGLGAEAMQPEWCLLNENECPVNAYAAADDTDFY